MLPSPRVLFIPTSNSGTVYWRLFNFANVGHRVGAMKTELFWWDKEVNDIHPWEVECARGGMKYYINKNIMDLAQLADAIVVQYLHLTAGLQMVRQIRDAFPRKPIIMEIDDYILNVPVYNAARATYDPGAMPRDVALQQMREADAVVCSTPYLADAYAEFNENIHTMPNSIDFSLWDKLNKPDGKGIRIGWAGGQTHGADLKPLEPIIRRITEKHKNAKFVFLVGAPKEWNAIPGVEIHDKWTRIDKYPARLAQLGLDIFLAPLQDNAFNRGKSNLRWLEASALGIPTVAYIPTDNGGFTHFERTMKHGTDGLIANNAADFERCLESLIMDRPARLKMGALANDAVRRGFNAEAISAQYADMIRAEISRKGQTDEQSECAESGLTDGRGPKPDEVQPQPV